MIIPRPRLTVPFLLFCLSFAARPSHADRTPQQAVLEGNRLLAEGAYSEAARSFGEAIGESGVPTSLGSEGNCPPASRRMMGF